MQEAKFLNLGKQQSKDPDWIWCESPEKAFSYLQDPQVAVLLVDCDKDDKQYKKYLHVLERFEREASHITRVFLAEELNFATFKQVVNETHIDICLERELFNQNPKKYLNQALEKHRESVARTFLLRESTRQFRELEALNNSLEKIVLERTQHIEISKVDEEEKLNKVRSLIRLIKDLAQTSSFEELLQVIRKEFRKFHKIGDPILVYQASPERVEIISFQSGQIVFGHFKGEFPFSRDIQVQDRAVVKTLANHFGRPFMKILSVPLDPKLMRKTAFYAAEATLCVEVSLGEAELNKFLDFIKERSQSIATTVDRLLLENELVQFSYRWERTFDGFRDPIAIIDVDFEVLRASKKFSDKVIRKRCFESFAGKEEMCEGCPVPAAMSTGKPQTGQIKVGDRLYQVHSYPILFEQSGHVTNVVNQYVDITQSRDLYLRLLQSEKLGAIGGLAGNIAHELNNPLTGLRSLSQVLLQQVDKDSSLSSDLHEIEKAAARSQQIIKNLREFSQGGPQQKRLMNIDDIVNKTIPLLKTVMRIHRQEFQLNTPTSLIEVEPHFIQQVVFNLVNNACQAMKDPGTLTVRTQYLKKEKKVLLEVSDTGSGIPVEIREKIFEPFFTTKKEGLGTGLGLSLTKKIVESLGGEIRLFSEVNKGSQFQVLFPEASEKSEQEK